MNPIRRRMLHPLRSRHNPLTRAALILIPLATITAVACALLEAESIRETATAYEARIAADKSMIAELTQFAEGEAKLVEVTGKYAVERTVKRKTYEVK